MKGMDEAKFNAQFVDPFASDPTKPTFDPFAEDKEALPTTGFSSKGGDPFAAPKSPNNQTTSNGQSRSNPDLFADLVKNLHNLMFFFSSSSSSSWIWTYLEWWHFVFGFFTSVRTNSWTSSTSTNNHFLWWQEEINPTIAFDAANHYTRIWRHATNSIAIKL